MQVKLVMIKENTLRALELFQEELLGSIILHIPHAGVAIPFYDGYVDPALLQHEINLLTDFATDEIFNIDEISNLVFPYSRVFCDVERLADEEEEMYEYGRGFFYTHTDDGQLLRKDVNGIKQKVFEGFYQPHHETLSRTVAEKLEKHQTVILIDCHSFPDVPFQTDLDKTPGRPDFCIGTDEFHTPKWLSDLVFNHLKNAGYSVKVNSPYSGTIVPLEYYRKNKQVMSIMIEVNRKLYMQGQDIVELEVKKLNQLITKMLLD
jgi:N-formylglutamate deformylase